MSPLVDTSVWIDHLRREDRRLCDALTAGTVMIHEAIIGEMACGNISRREAVLGLMMMLPRVNSATFEEVLGMLTRQRLYGLGLGWVDVHLLAACRLSNVALWTHDRRLREVATRVGVTLAP